MCHRGCRLILHGITTHHFLLFQRDVPSFSGTSVWSFLPSYVSKSRKIEENVKMTKHGKCRNRAHKTIAAFLCTPRQSFLESLLETAQEMLPCCGLRMVFPSLTQPLKSLCVAPFPLQLEGQKAKIRGRDENNLLETVMRNNEKMSSNAECQRR